MGLFCTECGQRKESADALFCTHCGHRFPSGTTVFQPTLAPLASDPLRSPAASLRRPGKRTLLLGGAGLALLFALGAGVAYYMRPPAATPEAYTEAINHHLASHREQAQDKVCLSNFPYATNPVFTNASDTATNHWLDLLVKAGLYRQPDTLTEGFWTKLRYTQTDKGHTVLKEGRLCLAKGLKVERIESVLPPETIAGALVGKAVFSTTLDAPADWVTEEMRRELPGEGHLTGQTLLLTVQDGAWQVMDAAQLQRSQMAQAPSPEAGTSGLRGWWQRLTGPTEPDDDAIWTALMPHVHGLSREALQLRKGSCERQAEGRFRCVIHLGDREERISLIREGESWVLQDE